MTLIKYMVWIGIQGSTYITVEADSPEQAKELAKELAIKQLEDVPVDIFVGDADEL